MKILLGSHGFPPNQAAGAEWRTYRTARWLSEHGHSVQVIAVDQISRAVTDKIEVVDDSVDGIQVKRLSYGLDQRVGTLAEFDNPVAYQVIKDLLAREPYDVFHLICGYRISGSTLRAAYEARVPSILTLTDFWFLCPRLTLRRSTGELCNVPSDTLECAACMMGEQRRYRWPHTWSGGQTSRLLRTWWRATDFAAFPEAGKLNKAMLKRRDSMRQMLALVSQIVAPSQFMADFFIQQDVPQEQITVMRQGVKVAKHAGDRPRKGASYPIVFGYIGQLAEHKGVDLLVRAFRSLPCHAGQIKLMIYGDPAQAWPPFWKKLQGLLGEDERIVVAGPFANADVATVYNGLDVLVMPSIWYENSPNVILEAFACKVPVIASNLGGMAELVTHNVNGLLFENGNVSALAGVLDKVVNERTLLDTFSGNIRPPVTIQEEMNNLTAIYHKVLAKKPPVPGLQFSPLGKA